MFYLNVTMTATTHRYGFRCNKCNQHTAWHTPLEAYQASLDHKDNCEVGKHWMSGALKHPDDHIDYGTDDLGRPYTATYQQPTFVDQVWIEFDTILAAFLANRTDDALKRRSDALAQAIFGMDDTWQTVDDVKREAMRRQKIIAGEVTWSPTPGMNFNPAPNYGPAPKTERMKRQEEEHNRQRRNAGSKAASTARSPRKQEQLPALTQDQIEKIKATLATGMLTIEQIAASMKISAAGLRAVLG